MTLTKTTLGGKSYHVPFAPHSPGRSFFHPFPDGVLPGSPGSMEAAKSKPCILPNLIHGRTRKDPEADDV